MILAVITLSPNYKLKKLSLNRFSERGGTLKIESFSSLAQN